MYICLYYFRVVLATVVTVLVSIKVYVIYFTVITGWIGLGSVFYKPYVYKYPVSTAGCPVDNSTISDSSSLILGNITEVYNTANYTTSTQVLTSTTTKSVEELFAERLVYIICILYVHIHIVYCMYTYM